MSGISPENLTQTDEFDKPTVLDIFGFEDIFDRNGFPYLAFSPRNYYPAGPQMELGHFPDEDQTGRKDHEGIVNLTERQNSQEHFGDAMKILQKLRDDYVADESIEEPINYSDALRISHMGIELPRYLIWRENPPYKNGELPPESVLLSRALRGFHGLVFAMSFGVPPDSKNREAFMTKPFSASEVMYPIISKKALENKLVCAAHINMINLMLKIFEGNKTFGAPVDIEFDYDAADLRDFSKSLRSIWDIVYPNIEAGLKKSGYFVTGRSPSSENEEGLKNRELDIAVQVANMANFLTARVVGRPNVILSLGEIKAAFIEYVGSAQQREEDLELEITGFKSGE